MKNSKHAELSKNKKIIFILAHLIGFALVGCALWNFYWLLHWCFSIVFITIQYITSDKIPNYIGEAVFKIILIVIKIVLILVSIAYFTRAGRRRKVEKNCLFFNPFTTYDKNNLSSLLEWSHDNQELLFSLAGGGMLISSIGLLYSYSCYREHVRTLQAQRLLHERLRYKIRHKLNTEDRVKSLKAAELDWFLAKVELCETKPNADFWYIYNNIFIFLEKRSLLVHRWGLLPIEFIGNRNFGFKNGYPTRDTWVPLPNGDEVRVFSKNLYFKYWKDEDTFNPKGKTYFDAISFLRRQNTIVFKKYPATDFYTPVGLEGWQLKQQGIIVNKEFVINNGPRRIADMLAGAIHTTPSAGLDHRGIEIPPIFSYTEANIIDYFIETWRSLTDGQQTCCVLIGRSFFMIIAHVIWLCRFFNYNLYDRHIWFTFYKRITSVLINQNAYMSEVPVFYKFITDNFRYSSKFFRIKYKIIKRFLIRDLWLGKL